MLTIYRFKSTHPDASVFFKSDGEIKGFPINSVSLRSQFSFFIPSNSSHFHSISNQIDIKKSILCARNRKRRSGSDKSVRFMLHTAYFIASKLNIIPEPVHLVLREFGGGNGGGLGFNKDFGWGGFDGRRRGRKFDILGVLVVLGLGFGLWLLVLGKEVNVDVFVGILVVSVVGVSAVWGKINVQDWVLGFCSCAFMVVLGMRREKLKNWMKGFGAADIFRRGGGRRRRTSRFWSIVR